MSSRATRDPEAALSDSFPTDGKSTRLEVWVHLAHLLFFLFIGGIFYLGARPGGAGPLFVYMEGRLLLGLVALLLLVFALAYSAWKRPFRQRGRIRAFLLLVTVVGLVNMPFPYPSSHEKHPSRTCFQLPFEGQWTVLWGGEDTEGNRLASMLPDRRWGLDLVFEREGLLFEGAGEEPEDWFAFGQPVLAPAAGRVVRIETGQVDGPPRRPNPGATPEGNLVVLEVAENEFCFLTHLKQGSIEVQVGAKVEAGQKLAEVGSSGFSPFTPMPHLAVHLQDTSEGRGEAIPWRFCGYRVNGAPVEEGLPRGGLSDEGHRIGQRVERGNP